MTITSEQARPATTSASIEAFEATYREAAGDSSRIPWADGRPSPALVNWLNAVAPSIIRCGARVAVVGCGLGDDARALLARGYEVTAFDVAPTAVRWARELDPTHAECYFEADLFDPPPRWRHRFDLVVEVNTIQSLPPDRHGDAMRSIGEMLSPHGHLLLICRGAVDAAAAAAAEGPPFPLTEDDLLRHASLAGLVPEGDVSSFDDDEDPPVRRMRGVFVRA